MSILEGSVVFVDDEFEATDSLANAFYASLRLEGRPVAAYKEVPPIGHLDHWDGLSLVVLDWNLSESEERDLHVELPRDLAEDRRGELIGFLISLLDRYFCPVFIVSADAPDQIREALLQAHGFPAAAIGRRVQILQKHAEDLLPRLESAVRSDPTLSTFRTWEQQYQMAKNRMFNDLDGLGTDWLGYIIDSAESDGTDIGHELVSSLYGNLQHRVNPVAFDLSVLATVDRAIEGEAERRVVHGRSVLLEERLYKSTIMPGDYFKKWRKTDPDDAIWINITPACYTVQGRSERDVRLHLIRGVPESISGTLRPESLRKERAKQSRSGTIDVLHDGKAYRFDFSTLETFAWSTVRKNRLGRLLPPYITYLQQKHATYLTSEGLPSVLPRVYKVHTPEVTHESL